MEIDTYLAGQSGSLLVLLVFVIPLVFVPIPVRIDQVCPLIAAHLAADEDVALQALVRFSPSQSTSAAFPGARCPPHPGRNEGTIVALGASGRAVPAD